MRVKRGEIYIAVDGSKCGHLVLDVEKYKHCMDIVTQPFQENGIYGLDFIDHIPERVDAIVPNRIDKFKLTQVRYYRCDDNQIPKWIPREIIEMRSKI